MGVWLMNATTPTIFEIKRVQNLSYNSAKEFVAALATMKFERGRAAKKGDDASVRRIDAAISALKALIDADKTRKGNR